MYMLLNFNPKPSGANKKQIEKQEQEKRDQYSAVVRSAEYKAQQEKIDAPFGKAFKTGPVKSKKDYKREKYYKNNSD